MYPKHTHTRAGSHTHLVALVKIQRVSGVNAVGLVGIALQQFFALQGDGIAVEGTSRRFYTT